MPPGMRAQSSNQAALVIRHGDNDVRTACVDFDEPQISGYELMQRSGFDLQIGVQGLGSLVCSIDNTGCPASDCLCQCKGGGDCVYWSYWHRLAGNWQYSQGGASVYMVEPGVVEGWSWGPGAVNQAVPPPDLSFDEVCQTAATNTPTSSPTATNTQPAIVITLAATATRNPAQAATAALPSSTPTSSPTVEPTLIQQATMTPVPLPQQTVATTIPTNTPAAAQETVPVVVTAGESTPQIVLENTQEPELTTAVDAVPTRTSVVNSTPAPLAVVQRIKPATIEATPMQNTQQLAEPTAPLQVIGEGVVPTAGSDLGEPDIADMDAGTANVPEMLPYLVFLLIVAGLGGLLGFVSLRRRRQP